MESLRLFDPAWLQRTYESALDPDQLILDPHHHIFPSFDPPYGVAELEADLGAGHNVAATVYIEALTQWYRDGPAHLRPVGETAFAAAIGEAADARGAPRIAAAIIGHGEFARGVAAVQAALEAHVEAGRGRFRGLRANLFWSEEIDLGIPMPPKDLCATTAFRDGFAHLAPMGLVCDIFAFAENLPAIARLAADFPETPIVIDHCGAPAYALQDNADGRARFALWRQHIRALAACDNVSMKVGGAGGALYAPLAPLDLHRRAAPLDSIKLANLIQPLYEECLAAFGTRRIMLESNFPIDRRDYGYTILWNAFKRLTRTLTIEERADLYWRTAADFYSIDMPSGVDTKAIA